MLSYVFCFCFGTFQNLSLCREIQNSEHADYFSVITSGAHAIHAKYSIYQICGYDSFIYLKKIPVIFILVLEGSENDIPK